MRIFADGGCSGNPGPGGWAYVIVKDSSGSDNISHSDDLSALILKEAWGAVRNTTNNRMELQAVISALEALSALDPAGIQVSKPQFYDDFTQNKRTRLKIEVYTDSQYVQKGMSQWIKDWKARGWRTAAKDPVKNQDLWQRLDTLVADFSIAWHWIKGHAGNLFNEHCDTLTQKAINTLICNEPEFVKKTLVLHTE